MSLAAIAAEDYERVSIGWLVAGYALVTLGELCLSPMGLSVVSKLAPQRHAAAYMGGWFVATAIGNYLSGFIASYWHKWGPTNFFMVIVLTSIAAGLILASNLKKLEKVLPHEKH